MPGADAYSLTRGDLHALVSGEYGSCLIEGLEETLFQDLDVPSSGAGYSYLVQAQNYDCGQGSMGFDELEQPIVNLDPAACAGAAVVDAYPESEETIYGTVRGDYLDTWAADDLTEELTEETTSGGPSTRISSLEHRWTLQVSSGARVELHVEGYRTDSPDGDNFVFEYSTDSVVWNPIAMPDLPFTDEQTDLIGLLPPSLSGSVTVRVTDTNRDPGGSTKDEVTIDELFVRAVP
jgi:hypothetical protein